VNEHLTPVFEVVLPAIEHAGIPYWVYGGVAIAGINGEFVRANTDVDLFVVDEDYEAARDSIELLGKELGWTPRDTNFRARPKREWFELGNDKDLLSIMPVYKGDGRVRIVFQTSTNDYPISVLTQRQRRLGPFVFPTPDNSYIKDLFIRNLKYLIKSGRFRDRPELREKYEKDANVILNEVERDFYWGQYR
jgi:hypothetical protein